MWVLLVFVAYQGYGGGVVPGVFPTGSVELSDRSRVVEIHK